MNHADDQIDIVLAALRDAAPPEGLEDRLLLSLEAAQVRVPHVSPLRHGWTTKIFSVRLWIPTALAAAILALVFAIHLHHPSTPTQTSTTGAVEAPTTTKSSQERVILSEAQRSRRTLRLSTHLNSPNLSTSALRITTSTPYEQAALADTLAPSQPSPPLPLTQQERLLLRCTRHSQLTEVAELDPTHQQTFQAAIAARESATLQRYTRSLLSTLVASYQLNSDPAPDEAPSPPPPQDPPTPVQQPISSH